jgi:hypothetical protein
VIVTRVIAIKAIVTRATATKATASACIAVGAAIVVAVVIARIGPTTPAAISKARPRNRHKTKAAVTSRVSLSRPTIAARFGANRFQN